jgi:hypothetical protein
VSDESVADSADLRADLRQPGADRGHVRADTDRPRHAVVEPADSAFGHALVARAVLVGLLGRVLGVRIAARAEREFSGRLRSRGVRHGLLPGVGAAAADTAGDVECYRALR